MNQTKLESLLESFFNILIGYFVALGSQLIIFPLVGIDISFNTNLIIGFWFTLISLARSYFIRRFFNNGLHIISAKAAKKLICIGGGGI